MAHLSQFFSRSLMRRVFLLGSIVVISGIAVVAQTARNRPVIDEQPVFHEYRGVQLGLLADEVRKKLGEPANKSDEQDYYLFGEKEIAQILYDKATRKVITISVDFMTGASGVLTPQQVFGAEIEAKTDGSKYKLIRYPKAGYWLSYSKTAGDTPTITVTITKIAQ